MSDSVHNKLKRVRKPRVHISYEVETGNARVNRELPFVVGVMGDYSGDNSENKKALRDRKLVSIDRDNFDETMAKIAPTLSFKVENKLANDGSEMSVSLKFNSMDDFHPDQLVEQVEPLKKLLEARNKLRDLLSKADRSEALESILENVLQSSDEMVKLSQQLGLDKKKGE